MPVAEPPQADEAPHVTRRRLEVVVDQADGGWYAARIDGFGPEAPGVFGQGRTPDEAERDALSALHDLVYRPTRSERLLYRLRSGRAHLRDRLLAH
jgi:predicted RNase H-like HicB family nuclease